MSDKFANVIINISHEKLDHPFSYKIPPQLVPYVSAGVRVKVPFGNGNHERWGYVLSVTDSTEYPVDKVKSIIGIEKGDDFVEGKLIALAGWMSKNYGSTMINALKTVLPIKKDVKEAEEKTVELVLNEEKAQEKLAFYNRKHQVARARLLNALLEEKTIDYRIVVNKLNIQTATIKLMEEDGVLRVDSKRKYRNPVSAECVGKIHNLNDEQQKIVDEFIKNDSEGKKKTYLIHGITGSGKTEVYMEMIDYVVRSGRQAIVLIPEIALTYQTVMRFYKRFGDSVSTLHSRLSAGEKYDQFERAKKGEIKVMIGPRSALFTPFDKLGLIVIDEEHESSYKSDNMPKYHAKEVARKLCDMHGASLVLGSATPSINSYFEAKQGKYELYKLMNRAANESVLPSVDVIDLREELKAGNKTMFSGKLSNLISDRLSKGEQIMLFLNRRGKNSSVFCRACGETIKCPHCDVSLSLHKDGKLRCHYCGHEQDEVKTCPSCGSAYIGGMGTGTQKVEEAVKKMFPQAVTLRMDYDTTRQKGSYDDILSRFANREADILIGTQMIVKGHDFPYVTLMGILAADMSLNANDYRASERTFQLLVQAAGRAGRGNRPGNVIIQTYQPDHYAVINSMKQDYDSFYEEEIGFRSLVGYPPTGHMLAILIESTSEQSAIDYSHSLAQKLNDDIINCYKGQRVLTIGPCAGSIKKLNDYYRQVIYVKAKDIEPLVGLKDSAELYGSENIVRDLRQSFDFDPLNGY